MLKKTQDIELGLNCPHCRKKLHVEKALSDKRNKIMFYFCVSESCLNLWKFTQKELLFNKRNLSRMTKLILKRATSNNTNISNDSYKGDNQNNW